MLTLGSIRPLIVLFRRFLAPYRLRFLAGILVSVLVGFFSTAHTLVFAPALQLFTGEHTLPAESFGELNLNNLGPTLLQEFGLDPRNPVQIVLLVSSAYLMVAILIGSLMTLGRVFIIQIRVGLIHDMTQQIHGFLIRQPMEYFNARNVGDFLSRFHNDVREAAKGIESSVSSLMVSSIHIMLTVVVLSKTDPLLTLGILGLGGIHFLVTAVLSPKLVKALSSNLKHIGNVNHLLLESLNGIRVVKTMAGERYVERGVREHLSLWKNSFFRTAIIRAIDQPLRLVIDSMIISLALVMTFYSMHLGRMSLEASALYIALCLRLIPPVSQLATGLFHLNGSVAGANRVLEILEADQVIEDGDLEPEPLQDQVRFDGVHFRYVKETPVIQGLSLDIHKGEKIALVGGSGSGKTTLTDLLLRLYDPTQGTILFDGVDIRKFHQRSYRKIFGVVSQDSLLFSGTVKENILYGRSFDPVLYERAKGVANCQFIDEFTDGDDARVGDRGVTLSGGQRQRVALARAVYNQPDFLILDEATSALDAESEKLVQEGIQRAIQNATAIIIAHRLSTVREVDRIVVLEEGRIHQIGTHEELVQSSPIYQNLCKLQFLPEVSNGG